MNTHFTDEQKDALKEIMTIGAGNAATALSQMLRKRVSIEIPKVNLASIDKAPAIFGGEEALVTTVYLQLYGDASGVILFSFHKNEANKLADLLLDNPTGKTKILNDMGKSAIQETASILSGAYLSALSKLLNMKLLVSTPAIAHDMSGAIVDNILIETSKEADYTLIIDTELYIVEEKVMAYFFFIPDVESLRKILNTLGMEGNSN